MTDTVDAKGVCTNHEVALRADIAGWRAELDDVGTELSYLAAEYGRNLEYAPPEIVQRVAALASERRELRHCIAEARQQIHALHRREAQQKQEKQSC